MRTLALTTGMLLALAAPRLRADTAMPSRDELQQAYKNELQNSPSLFDTAPIYHIVPSENTITFAGAANYIDVTVGPPGQDIKAKRTGQPVYLDYTGWSGSPYLAFSGKTFAIGLTGAVGGATSHFIREESAADPVKSRPAMTYQEQYSTMSYSGVGLFVYYSPTWLLPSNATLTLVAGGDSLSVTQNESGTLTDRISDATLRKYRYTVLKGIAGLNVGVRLAKRFLFIPWVDYSTNQVTKAQTDNNAIASSVIDPALQQNIDLYWHNEPSLRYGLDFAVKLGAFEVHLGGLFGLLGNFNKGSDRIKDNSNSLTLSFNMKGS